MRPGPGQGRALAATRREGNLGRRQRLTLGGGDGCAAPSIHRISLTCTHRTVEGDRVPLTPLAFKGPPLMPPQGLGLVSEGVRAGGPPAALPAVLCPPPGPSPAGGVSRQPGARLLTCGTLLSPSGGSGGRAHPVGTRSNASGLGGRGKENCPQHTAWPAARPSPNNKPSLPEHHLAPGDSHGPFRANSQALMPPTLPRHRQKARHFRPKLAPTRRGRRAPDTFLRVRPGFFTVARSPEGPVERQAKRTGQTGQSRGWLFKTRLPAFNPPDEDTALPRGARGETESPVGRRRKGGGRCFTGYRGCGDGWGRARAASRRDTRPVGKASFLHAVRGSSSTNQKERTLAGCPAKPSVGGLPAWLTPPPPT